MLVTDLRDVSEHASLKRNRTIETKELTAEATEHAPKYLFHTLYYFFMFMLIARETSFWSSNSFVFCTC